MKRQGREATEERPIILEGPAVRLTESRVGKMPRISLRNSMLTANACEIFPEEDIEKREELP